MISVEEYLDVCDAALDGYAQVCRALGDDLVSVRLEDVPGSNSAFGIVAHVVGVMAWWGRRVNRGIALPRDRDAEFRATGTVDEALALLNAGRAGLHEDVAAARPREAPVAPPPPRTTSPQPRAPSSSTSTRSWPSTSGSSRSPATSSSPGTAELSAGCGRMSV